MELLLSLRLQTELCNLSVNTYVSGYFNENLSLVGYELAIVSAPRSMQATAMGMFFSLDGFANLVLLAVSLCDGAEITDSYYYAGIGLNILAVISLTLIRKRMDFF